jgi:hypothetical protein
LPGGAGRGAQVCAPVRPFPPCGLKAGPRKPRFPPAEPLPEGRFPESGFPRQSRERARGCGGGVYRLGADLFRPKRQARQRLPAVRLCRCSSGGAAWRTTSHHPTTHHLPGTPWKAQVRLSRCSSGGAAAHGAHGASMRCGDGLRGPERRRLGRFGPRPKVGRPRLQACGAAHLLFLSLSLPSPPSLPPCLPLSSMSLTHTLSLAFVSVSVLDTN